MKKPCINCKNWHAGCEYACEKYMRWNGEEWLIQYMRILNHLRTIEDAHEQAQADLYNPSITCKPSEAGGHTSEISKPTEQEALKVIDRKKPVTSRKDWQRYDAEKTTAEAVIFSAGLTAEELNIISKRYSANDGKPYDYEYVTRAINKLKSPMLRVSMGTIFNRAQSAYEKIGAKI